MNILNFQKMNLNYEYFYLHVDNYRDIKILIIIILIILRFNRIIKTFFIITISIYINIFVFIRFRDIFKLLLKKNFIFVFYKQTFNRFDLKNDIILYIIDANFIIMRINNTFE